MNGQYDHLGLKRWPFPIVPEREFCTFIADRKRLRVDIEDLLSNLSRRDTSSIHLFWAWFGAGKTHTLFYLTNKAEEISKQKTQHTLYSIYTEFPKSARTFLDLYRSFITALDTDILIDAFSEIYTSADSSRLRREMRLASPDLVNALQVMVTGKNQEPVTAMRWLRAEALPLSDFRKVGISQKINSSEEATRILAALVEMLIVAARSQDRPGCRVIWLIDEFQRIERTGSRTIDEMNTGLHSTFNACPNGLSLILSFSGKPQSNSLPTWLSRELRDRIGRTKVMILPPMLPEEALVFVKDVLAQFHPPESIHFPYFPFTEQTCEAIIEQIRHQGELKPRSIMHAFNAVLQEADRKLETKEIEVISPEFAKRVLAEYVLLVDNEEG